MRFNARKSVRSEWHLPSLPVICLLASSFFLPMSWGRFLRADTMGIDKEIVLTISGKKVDFGKLSLAAPINYTDDEGGLGVSETGSFEGNYPPVKKGVVFNWVQIITTNDPFKTSANANQPYFDPGDLDMRGDNAPFYWNTTLKGKDGMEHPELYYMNNLTASGNGIRFEDTPARASRDAPVNWTSELDLVCWMPGTTQFSVLWSGNYGFNIDKEKTRTVSGITELNAPVLLTQKFLTANFNGWTLADPGSCCVPEPAGCFGIVIALAIAWNRPAHRASLAA